MIARACILTGFAGQQKDRPGPVGIAVVAVLGRDLENVAVLVASARVGAVDLLGPKYALPLKALGTHQSYWLWGPGDTSKDVIIVLGDRVEGLSKWCGDVQVAARLSHPYTAVWENGPVLVCRQPRFTLAELWPKVRNWD